MDISAGAIIIMPVMDAFWGDRYGQLKDPFGHLWFIATHKQDLSQEEIQKAGETVLKDMMGITKVQPLKSHAMSHIPQHSLLILPNRAEC